MYNCDAFTYDGLQRPNNQFNSHTKPWRYIDFECMGVNFRIQKFWWLWHIISINNINTWIVFILISSTVAGRVIYFCFFPYWSPLNPLIMRLMFNSYVFCVLIIRILRKDKQEKKNVLLFRGLSFRIEVGKTALFIKVNHILRHVGKTVLNLESKYL